jgi:hypothetical protein
MNLADVYFLRGNGNRPWVKPWSNENPIKLQVKQPFWQFVEKTVNKVAIDLRMRWFMKIIDRLVKRILCFSKLQIYVSALCHARNPVALRLCQFLTFRGDDTNLISADVPATPMHASRPISIDFLSVSQCYQRCFASMLNRAKIFWSCKVRLWL